MIRSGRRKITAAFGLLALAGLLVIAMSLAAGCSRGGAADDSAEDVSMYLKVTPDPPQVGPAVIEITLLDADGQPINDADLEIVGNMSHAGMEPVSAHIAGGNAGRYTTSDFEFTMGGDWTITVTGALSDGSELRRTFDLSGVST